MDIHEEEMNGTKMSNNGPGWNRMAKNEHVLRRSWVCTAEHIM